MGLCLYLALVFLEGSLRRLFSCFYDPRWGLVSFNNMLLVYIAKYEEDYS